MSDFAWQIFVFNLFISRSFSFFTWRTVMVIFFLCVCVLLAAVPVEVSF